MRHRASAEGRRTAQEVQVGFGGVDDGPMGRIPRPSVADWMAAWGVKADLPTAIPSEVTLREGATRTGLQVALETECHLLGPELDAHQNTPWTVGRSELRASRVTGGYATRNVAG